MAPSNAPQPDSFSDLTLGKRLASAVVLIAVALTVAFLGGWVFTTFVGLALFGLLSEWARLVRLRDPYREEAPLLVGAGTALVLTVLGLPVAGIVAALAGGICGALLADKGARIWILVAPLYLILPALSVLWIRGSPDGLFHLLWLFAVVWSTDTGSFVTGRLIGGPAFVPWISPNKTWAGVIGGMALATVVAVVSAHGLAAFLPFEAGGLSMGRLVALGFLVSAATQGGDIVESALKRHFGVKDTGRVIPGHGGLLDRLDGFLFAVMVGALVMASGWDLT